MKGSELLVRRRAARVNQQQLVIRLGLHPHTIRDVECDRLGVSQETYTKWCKEIDAASKEQIVRRGKVVASV